MGSIRHAAVLQPTYKHELDEFTRVLRSTIQKSYVSGFGTRDLAGPSGLTTGLLFIFIFILLLSSPWLILFAAEQFVAHVAKWLAELVPKFEPKPSQLTEDGLVAMFKVSKSCGVAVRAHWARDKELDKDGKGTISVEDFTAGLKKLGIRPQDYGFGNSP
jgi:hypothetical protein